MFTLVLQGLRTFGIPLSSGVVTLLWVEGLNGDICVRRWSLFRSYPLHLYTVRLGWSSWGDGINLCRRSSIRKSQTEPMIVGGRVLCGRFPVKCRSLTTSVRLFLFGPVKLGCDLSRLPGICEVSKGTTTSSETSGYDVKLKSETGWDEDGGGKVSTIRNFLHVRTCGLTES